MVQEAAAILRHLSDRCPNDAVAASIVKILVDRSIDATSVASLPQQQQLQPQVGLGKGGLPFRPFLLVLKEILTLVDDPRLIQIRLENR